MPKLVLSGAKLKCSEGLSPSTLTVAPGSSPTSSETPAATIMDNVAMTNIAAFGMCKTQSNPQVASATSAASGVLTPMPCIPVVTAPWSSGAQKVTFQGKKALTDDSTCTCAWTGTIEISDPACDVEVE